MKQRGLHYTLDFGVDGVCPGHRLRELGDGVVPVVLRVDDEDDSAAPLEYLWSRRKKLDGHKIFDERLMSTQVFLWYRVIILMIYKFW